MLPASDLQRSPKMTAWRPVITRKNNVTENFYPRKQIWIDLVTHIDQSPTAQGTKKAQTKAFY